MDGNEGRNVIILVIHEKSSMSHLVALVTLVNPLNQNNVVGPCMLSAFADSLEGRYSGRSFKRLEPRLGGQVNVTTSNTKCSHCQLVNQNTNDSVIKPSILFLNRDP